MDYDNWNISIDIYAQQTCQTYVDVRIYFQLYIKMRTPHEGALNFCYEETDYLKLGRRNDILCDTNHDLKPIIIVDFGM